MRLAETRVSLRQPWLAVAVIAGLGPIVVATAPEAAAAEAGVILPVTPCAALEKSDLTPLDARITAAATVTRNGHPFCHVKGYISPVTQFEALLPQEDLARRLPAAGLRRALRQGERCQPRRSVADERLPGALRPALERRDGRRGR